MEISKREDFGKKIHVKTKVAIEKERQVYYRSCKQEAKGGIVLGR
jgi:hypothetical protein